VVIIYDPDFCQKIRISGRNKPIFGKNQIFVQSDKNTDFSPKIPISDRNTVF